MNKKTAIVIGASSGIGAATAILLSKSYTHVAITSYKNTTGLAQVRHAILANGMACYMESGDAGDFAFVKAFVANVVAQFGQVDLLINNAAISYVGLLTDMTPADWQSTMNANVDSIFNACNQVVPHMVGRKCGRIVNISSVWGNVGASCEVAYSASKGAVNTFTKALAKELAPSGIAVNAIAFGAVDTAMNGHLTPDEKKALEDEIPFERMATLEEAASFIVHVAEAPAYMTGQIIGFDGGWT